MVDLMRTGKRIASLRRELGLTQQQLAGRLDVTPQAVSKWENGTALPDTALLPDLARALGSSIDHLLAADDLLILSARYGTDGLLADVTARVGALVRADALDLVVSPAALGADPAPEKARFLLLKYATPAGLFFACAGEGEPLHIDLQTEGHRAEPGRLQVVVARYGTPTLYNDVAGRLQHLLLFERPCIHVNHEAFFSPPGVLGEEWLTVVYLSADDLHVVAVPEGEGVRVDRQALRLVREPYPYGASRTIAGVQRLGWDQGMDCTWAGAVTAALNAMGEETTYEQVMGASGACWRLAFLHPMWDFSSVDGLVAYDHATPCLQAFGYPLGEVVARVPKERRAAELQLIMREIAAGRPVPAINLRVTAEWGVICGYDGAGQSLACRTYFDGPGAAYERVENWPFILMHMGPKGDPLPPAEVLRRSLAIFLEAARLEPRRGYHLGFDAYRTWAVALLDDAWWADLPEERFRRFLCVNDFCYKALLDARRSGAVYLAASAGLLEGVDGLAALFAEVHGVLQGARDAVPTEPAAEADWRAVWTPERRHGQAQALLACLELEERAEVLAGRLLGR